MSVTGSKTDIVVQLRSRERKKSGLVKVVPIVIDDLLEQEVGPCGPWQWFLVCLAMLSTAATSNFPNFFDTQPRQRCHMGEVWEAEFTRNGLGFDRIVQLTGGALANTDKQSETFIGCQMFDADWDRGPLLPLNETDLSRLPVQNLTNKTVPCMHGYVYEFSSHQYQGGIVKEMNLVCDRHWMIPVGTSFFMVGMVLGYVLCGIWAGRWGRKSALLFFSFLEMGSIWLCSVARNFWLFSFLRFFVAIGSYAKLSAFNLIILEITVAKYRSLFNALVILGFNCVGRLVLVTVAYYLSDWRAMNFGASIHCALTLTYYCFVPESPRWLLAQERTLDAIRVLQNGRQINHLHKPGTVPSELLERLCEQEVFGSTVMRIHEVELDLQAYRVLQQTGKSMREQFHVLLSNWNLMRVTILSILIFNAYGFTFMGLVLYTRMIRQSVFIVSLLNALITVPGTVIAILSYRLFRRRRMPLASVLFVCALSLLAGGLYTYIKQPEQDWVMTVALELGLMFYAAIQCLFFIYIPELYPPSVRSQGFGLASGLGRIGSAGATYANELDYTVKHAVPMLLYACITLVTGLAVLCLPDTTGEERGERKLADNSETENQ